jgi:hypothetical protein
LTKLPGQRAKLLLTALLLFESLLCALRRRLKARRPHLRRGPPLLLQDIAPKLLLGHRLARSAESARTNRLCRHALLGNPALPPDVRKRLLDCRVLKLPHKRSDLRRVKPAARPRQSRNALLRRRAAHSGRAHQRLLRRRRRSPSTRRRNISARLRTANLTANIASNAAQSRHSALRGKTAHPRAAHNIRCTAGPGRPCAGRGNIRTQLRAADLGTNAASQPAHRARAHLRGLLTGANAAKQLPNAFLPQSGAKA